MLLFFRHVVEVFIELYTSYVSVPDSNASARLSRILPSQNPPFVRETRINKILRQSLIPSLWLDNFLLSYNIEFLLRWRKHCDSWLMRSLFTFSSQSYDLSLHALLGFDTIFGYLKQLCLSILSKQFALTSLL